MPHLTVNGITLSIRSGTGGRRYDDLGDEQRSVAGDLVAARTTVRRRWGLTTLALARATADAWSALLLGRGDVWRFTDSYSEKGLAKTTTSGTVTYNGSGGKHAKKVTLGAAAYVRWTPTGYDALSAGALNPTGDYTLLAWYYEAAAWQHYVIRNSNGSVTRYKNGASHGSATAWLTVTSGYVQIGDGTNAADLSDMVALPFAIPTDWVTEIYTAHNSRAWPACPTLEASGDLVSNPTTPLTVRCRDVQESPEPLASDAAAKRVEFSMVEV